MTIRLITKNPRTGKTLPVLISSISEDYPTLKLHFPECFGSLKNSLLSSNDKAQIKSSQLISSFNTRLARSKNDQEILSLQLGLEELRAFLKATVQADISNYLDDKPKASGLDIFEAYSMNDLLHQENIDVRSGKKLFTGISASVLCEA